jgi:osmoprotectant transport system substrate-binding protein
MRYTRTLALGAAALTLVMSACTSGESGSPGESAAASGSVERPVVSIGSAGFPEVAVVAEIYAQALEAKGFTVERHLELGERPAVRSAFDAGEINLAPDYIGGLAAVLEAEVTSDPDETHANMLAALEEIGQTALDYSPGTDLDGFAVRQETADELGVTTMSELAEVADQLVWGLATGCPENDLCAGRLNELYGIDIATLDTELLSACSVEIAEALNNSAIGVAQVCTTQAEIQTFNFVVMEDDKGFSPAQNLTAVMTQELADAGGDDLASTLNAVIELLTDEQLISLNAQVAEQTSYEDIAAQWLTDNGLN